MQAFDVKKAAVIHIITERRRSKISRRAVIKAPSSATTLHLPIGKIPGLITAAIAIPPACPADINEFTAADELIIIHHALFLDARRQCHARSRSAFMLKRGVVYRAMSL